ncbi:MAG: hypothetical protein O2944_00255 [Proteobacteria bacterium]|nr:hypothetical protein [Pseudomonadota bacterium]
MLYTLEKFADDCRSALKSDAGTAGQEAVRGLVAKVLTDQSFIATHVPSTAEKERNVLYEDPKFGFCICAHVYKGAKNGEPHDHGPTWAVYGQAAGETEMTDWRIVEQAQGETPALVEKTRTYKLVPGDAHLYVTGAVHAPYRAGPTRLIRIEGQNTDKIKRTKIKPV